jgi:MraZ protein
MDTKGRVSIPSALRAELERRSSGAPVLTTGLEWLELHPSDDWQEQEAQLVNSNAFDTNVAALRRYRISGAVDGKIDSQGRLLVPPFMREHAQIGRDVVIAGVGKYVELWDKARFDQEMSRTQAHLPEIQQKVADLGSGKDG